MSSELERASGTREWDAVMENGGASKLWDAGNTGQASGNLKPRRNVRALLRYLRQKLQMAHHVASNPVTICAKRPGHARLGLQGDEDLLSTHSLVSIVRVKNRLQSLLYISIAELGLLLNIS
jgi:hypothetical protein